MIWTRAERELFKNYCSSTIKPPRHVLTKALTGEGLRVGLAGPNTETYSFQNLLRFLG